MIVYHNDVDCAMLCKDWPSSCEAQDVLLLSIPRDGWTFHLTDTFYMEDTCQHTAAKTLDTPWGQRWFHIWTQPSRTGLIVVKQPAPQRPLAVSCSLDAEEQDLRATFALLSGRVLATETYSISSGEPLLLEDLQEAASLHAYQQGLLETSYQEVACQLEGFTQELPGGLVLWRESTVTSERLRAWLAHLQDLSPAKLDSWDFYAIMDITASAPGSPTDEILDNAADQGLS